MQSRDGSSLETGQSGSGVHIVMPNKIINSPFNNPVGTSNYTAELTAIERALKIINGEKHRASQIYILSDSRSAIQAIESSFRSTADNLNRITVEIERASEHAAVHFRWIPSHTGIMGNEAADQLAKSGAVQLDSTNKDMLTADEYKALRLKKSVTDWKGEIKHDWYAETKPGSSLRLGLTRQEQTALCRLKSGHTILMEYRAGAKHFPTCTKCNTLPASPGHLLQCVGSSAANLFKAPATTLCKLIRENLMALL